MISDLCKISIDDLRPGMYISDVYNEAGRLLYSADKIIDGYHQIEALRRQGVFTVNIPEKKKPASITSNLTNTPETSSHSVEQYHSEIDEISELKQQSIQIVKNLFASAKTGQYSTIALLQKNLEVIIRRAIEKFDLFMALKVVHEDDKLLNHSINVAVLMAGLAESIGYTEDQVVDIAISGLLHDIGKTRLPQELLKKEAMLTRLESDLYKKHPSLGIELAKRLYRDLTPLNIAVISQHHERLNGCGYPQQLKGDQIQTGALICALADVYDSMTTEGYIKKALLPQEALALIYQGAEHEYPRNLVERFTLLLGIYPVGSFIRLESGEMGVVTKNNKKSLLLPQVMFFFDSSGRRISKPYIKDLSKEITIGGDEPLYRVSGSLNPVQWNFNPGIVLGDKNLENKKSGGERIRTSGRVTPTQV